MKKAMQFYEVSTIRHGIMIVGAAGTDKSRILESVTNSLTNIGDPITLYKLNPKSLTRKELFGYNDEFTNSFVHGVVS